MHVFHAGGTGRAPQGGSWRSPQALVLGGRLGFAPVKCWGDGDIRTRVRVHAHLGPELWAEEADFWEVGRRLSRTLRSLPEPETVL